MTWQTTAFLLAFVPLVASYFAYPLALWVIALVRGRGEPAPRPLPHDALPSVCVVVAAYNEEAVIEAKLRNLLELDYPAERLQLAIVSDGSSDATCARARGFLGTRRQQERDRVRIFERTERCGKTVALSETLPSLRGEIVVFSDANTHYRRDAVRRLVAHFGDPRVGLVCGNLQYIPSGGSAAGEAYYWRYENALKRLEGRLGQLLVANGSIYAVRRSLLEPIPGPVADDIAVPLLVASKGHLRVYDAEALAFERLPDSPGEEFRAKARIVAQGFEALRHYRREIAATGIGGMLQLVLHKVVRWLAAPLMAVMLLTSSGAEGAFLGAMLAGQFLFYAVALAGFLLPAVPWLPNPLRIPAYYCLVSVAALRGLYDFARGRTYATWETSPSTREAEGTPTLPEPARPSLAPPGRVAVLGGSGFIGSRLLDELANAGIEPCNGDIQPCPTHADVTRICDVRQKAELAAVCKGADVIVNLAAEHRDDVWPPSLYYEVNEDGARRVCEAAIENGIQRIVFTSSVAVYGNSPLEADERAEIAPSTDYGRSKWRAEQIYRDWLRGDPERSLVIIRPTAVFGEGGHGNVANLFRQVARGRFLMVGPGTNVKSLAYVGNLTAFIRHCLQLGPGEHLFNYVDKPDLDMNTLVERVNVSLGNRRRPLFRLPYWLGYLGGAFVDVAGMVLRRNFAIGRMRVKKFCLQTQSSAERALYSGFEPPYEIIDALDRTLRHGFPAGAPGRDWE